MSKKETLSTKQWKKSLITGLLSLLLAVLTICGNGLWVAAAPAYSVSLSPGRQTHTIGTTVYVNVNLSGGGKYSAGDFTFQYDNAYLTFDQSASTIPNNHEVTDQSGQIRVKFFGKEKALSSSFKLAFTVKKEGTSNVTLTVASLDAGSNAIMDIPAATITSATATITGEQPSYPVALPEGFTGAATVKKGATYTFSSGDTATYTFYGSTMSGGNVTIENSGNGSYAIRNVTGPIVIKAQRITTSHRVSFSGSARPDLSGSDTAFSGIDYSFSLNRQSSYQYGTPEIYIGSRVFTGYSLSGNTYTIPGSAIDGDILIRINRETSSGSGGSGITVTGNAVGQVKTDGVMDEDGNYIFSIDREAGYIYTVKATLDGKTVPVILRSDGSYLIRNADGELVIDVTRTPDVSVSVQTYLKLDQRKVMYLVMAKGPAEEGKAYCYFGEPMYYSTLYEAFVYPVISSELPTQFQEELASLITLEDGRNETLVYLGDLDGSGSVTEYDARLVQVMYSAGYSDFRSVTGRQFLEADLNGSGDLNMEDAAAVRYQYIQK